MLVDAWTQTWRNVRPIRVRTMLNVWPGSAKKRTDVLCLSVPPSWSFAVKPQTFWSCKVACQLPEVKCQKYGVGWRWTGNVQKKKYKMANPRNDKVPGIVPRLFNQNDVRNAVFYSFPHVPMFLPKPICTDPDRSLSLTTVSKTHNTCAWNGKGVWRFRVQTSLSWCWNYMGSPNPHIPWWIWNNLDLVAVYDISILPFRSFEKQFPSISNGQCSLAHWCTQKAKLFDTSLICPEGRSISIWLDLVTYSALSKYGNYLGSPTSIFRPVSDPFNTVAQSVPQLHLKTSRDVKSIYLHPQSSSTRSFRSRNCHNHYSPSRAVSHRSTWEEFSKLNAAFASPSGPRISSSVLKSVR